MTIKTIFTARHGYSSLWLPKEQQMPSRTGIETDVPLSEHGVNQSRELAHYILSIDTQPDIICSSPFYMCLETSEHIAGLLDLPVLVDKGLSNWFPTQSTIVPKPAAMTALNALFPKLLRKEWEEGTKIEPNENGETENELSERCSKFLKVFIEKIEHDYPDVETVLLMTHASVKIALGLNLLGFNKCESSLDEDGNVLEASSCSLDKFELLGDETAEDENDTESNTNSIKRWIITMNNNTEFLQKGDEKTWNFNKDAQIGDEGEEEEETETVYISVDLSSGSYKEKLEIDKNAIFQYSGLDKEQPLIRIGDRIYEGNWEKLVGTELAFPNAASINKRSSGNDNEHTEENPESTIQSTDKSKKKGISNKHAEKIYRITDRLVLSGLQPM